MAIDPDKRYSRNFNTLSQADQENLGQSHVAIVGLGGLGGGVCEFLARTGVGTLTLIDGDSFDATNLNRQLLSREDVLGNLKADEAGKRVALINSSVNVHLHQTFALEDNLTTLLLGVDLVVDCLDTIHSRFLLQKAALVLNIPLVSGAIAGVTGQVTVIFPGDKGFELIYGSQPENNDEDPGRGIETRTGNISYCAGFTAAVQASETVKVLLNKGDVLRNKLLIVDLLTNTMEVMDLI